jgi:hypothetical protein
MRSLIIAADSAAIMFLFTFAAKAAAISFLEFQSIGDDFFINLRI